MIVAIKAEEDILKEIFGRKNKEEEIEIEFIDREKEKTPEEKGLKETLKEIFRHRGFEEEEGEEEYYEEYE